jgi:hypothetical protein
MFLSLAWLIVAEQARAELTAQEAFRFVEVSAGANVNGHAPPDDASELESPLLGVFQHGDVASVLADNGTTPLDRARATATAQQRSLVQRKSVEALGETHIELEVDTLSGGGANGDGVTELLYNFTLDADTAYEVIGQVDRFGPVSDASLELKRAGTPILAIGEAAGYAQTVIAQTGTLPAGAYELRALVDTIHSQTGPNPSAPTTAGAEFGFGLFLDVVAPGEIVNGGFNVVNPTTGDVFRWTAGSPAAIDVDEVDDNFIATIESGPTSTLAQEVDTPATPFFVDFDYRFLETAGVLEVRLAGDLLAQLAAPGTVATSLEHARLLVNDATLGGLIKTSLEFRFAGPSNGLHVELDNVAFTLGLAGDFERDGDVDAADLPLWTAGFETDADGDADGDGDSDGADFLVWQRQVGAPPPAAAAATSVPEPSAAPLALAAIALHAGGRRLIVSSRRAPAAG